MFGKRKGREPVQQPSLVRREIEPSGGGLAAVIVPRSAVAPNAEPYALVQGVISFVNAMTEQALYVRGEIPAKALQAYHADYYLAQVNNGGHSQFVHNGRTFFDQIVADARSGLAGMGARAHLDLLEQTVAWAGQNKHEAAAQTGFNGGRAAALDALDKQFYALEKSTPMIPLSSRWIAGWPELKAVDDADYPVAIARMAALNPQREERLMVRSVRAIARQMTDPLYVGSGLACANCPDVEIRLGLGAGAMMEVEGEQRVAFRVHTNGGMRFCVLTDTHAAVYEAVAGDNAGLSPGASMAEVRAAILDGRIQNFKGPSIGRRLALAKRETIAGVVELAAEYRAAAAIDLALRRAGIDSEGTAVAAKAILPHPAGAVVNWIVLAKDKPFFAQSTSEGCALLHPGSDVPLIVVRQADVVAHQARVAAAA